MPTDTTDRDRLAEVIQRLNGSSLDARKGSLAEQAADALLPVVREMQAEAVIEMGDFFRNSASDIGSQKDAIAAQACYDRAERIRAGAW